MINLLDFLILIVSLVPDNARLEHMDFLQALAWLFDLRLWEDGSLSHK